MHHHVIVVGLVMRSKSNAIPVWRVPEAHRPKGQRASKNLNSAGNMIFTHTHTAQNLSVEYENRKEQSPDVAQPRRRTDKYISSTHAFHVLPRVGIQTEVDNILVCFIFVASILISGKPEERSQTADVDTCVQVARRMQ